MFNILTFSCFKKARKQRSKSISNFSPKRPLCTIRWLEWQLIRLEVLWMIN